MQKKKKKKFHEKHQCISEELKTKSDNMVAIDIKIAYKMKNKNQLSIEKRKYEI